MLTELNLVLYNTFIAEIVHFLGLTFRYYIVKYYMLIRVFKKIKTNKSRSKMSFSKNKLHIVTPDINISSVT